MDIQEISHFPSVLVVYFYIMLGHVVHPNRHHARIIGKQGRVGICTSKQGVS